MEVVRWSSKLSTCAHDFLRVLLPIIRYAIGRLTLSDKIIIVQDVHVQLGFFSFPFEILTRVERIASGVGVKPIVVVDLWAVGEVVNEVGRDGSCVEIAVASP